MGKGEDTRCVFPLTSLQIGDLQAYLSHLSLFLGPKSKKLYILVDNGPWLRDLVSKPAHLWQLMVTKSRSSPFANSKSRRERKDSEFKASPKSDAVKSKGHERWYSLIDAAELSQKKALLPVEKLKNSIILNSKLHGTLYGFIVFEVSWDNVRGINYMNELQTDTSLAIETKFMRRWEFDSISQAASCISSWFSGTQKEQLLMKEHLEDLLVLDGILGEVFHDSEEVFSGTNPCDDFRSPCNSSPMKDSSHIPGSNFHAYSTIAEDTASELKTPPLKKRKVCSEADVDAYSEERRGSPVQSSEVLGTSCSNGDAVEPTEYRDTLILFRFDNHDLPFKLRDIIMPDVRLLTLLESGLPSWAIFLQSYPGFCHFYRPWMCPLVRTLYVLMSIVTVLIGFYDLYKNVPVLKAAASRLCGPLLDWIETWEMVSRIKYLGTMLFLHNFQKAVQWFLMITRTTRSFLTVLTQPVAEPLIKMTQVLVPIWSTCIEVVESCCSVIWVFFESSFSLVFNIVQIFLQPLWFIISLMWGTATFVIYPIFWALGEILYAPIRLVLLLASFVGFIYTCIFEFLEELWFFVKSILKIASASEATVRTYEVSIWRSLWNDLFSQIFRAVRSILNGFVAFCTACNRHRLSIYNHIQGCIRRLYGRPRRSQHYTSIQNKNSGGYENLTRIRELRRRWLK